MGAFFKKRDQCRSVLWLLMNKAEEYSKKQQRLAAFWLNRTVNKISGLKIRVVFWVFTLLSTVGCIFIIIDAIQKKVNPLKVEQIKVPSSTPDSLDAVESIYKLLQRK
ncbi:MAG: hypothetical protein QM802_03265 [Agriterribacter sp.]